MPIVVIPSSVEVHGPSSMPFAPAGHAFRAASLAFAAGNPEAASNALALAAVRLDEAAQPASAARRALLDRAAVEHPAIARDEMPDMVDAVLVYDGYFGLARVLRATSAELSTAALAALSPLARFLAPAPLPLDDKATLASFAGQLLTGDGASSDGGDPIPAAGKDDTHVWLHPIERWRLGHAIYGLANRAAAVAVAEALEVCEIDPVRAAGCLHRGAYAVTAFTSAMELAAAMSGDEYRRDVRPTMNPPALEIPLTGLQNSDHATFRRTMASLVSELDQPFSELARHQRRLAEARERILQADLVDLERHISMTYRLVGSLPALDEDPASSAVQALRALRTRRLDRYSELLRHGWITAGEPAVSAG